MRRPAALRSIDAVLRAEPWLVAPHGGQRRLRTLIGVSVAGCVVYGLVMGSFSARPLQMLVTASKTPLLLSVSAALALPSFYVIHALLGLREDFGSAVRAVAASQAAMALVLAACAPLTMFWYVNVTRYDLALIFNVGVFALAAVTAQKVLTRFYAPLVARNPTHRRLRKLWLWLYGFIAVQMAWVLRPFIGAPGKPVQFFRESAWGNAYVELFELVRRLVMP